MCFFWRNSYATFYHHKIKREQAELATGSVRWKKMFLKIFQNWKGKHLWLSLFFNKVAGLRPATLLKKRSITVAFSVNFAKSLRGPFLQKTSKQLLLTKKKLIWKVFNSCFKVGPSVIYTFCKILHYAYFDSILVKENCCENTSIYGTSLLEWMEH